MRLTVVATTPADVRVTIRSRSTRPLLRTGRRSRSLLVSPRSISADATVRRPVRATDRIARRRQGDDAAAGQARRTTSRPFRQPRTVVFAAMTPGGVGSESSGGGGSEGDD